MSALGNKILRTTKQVIRRHGEDLVFTRRASTQGGTATTKTVRVIPQPLTQKDISSLFVEGMQNANQPKAHRFMAAGDADVQEATDTVPYLGNTCRVHSAIPQREGGASTALHIIIVAEGPAS